MKPFNFDSFMMGLVLGFMITSIIIMALTDTLWRKDIIDKQLAEWQIDPTTGKSQFYIFTAEEIKARPEKDQ
jgi:hypothetical protein